MIRFEYKKERARGGRTILRPIADVILENGKNSVEVGMYIDSGADISLIPLSVGLALGFKEQVEDIEEIKGITGESIPYIVKKIYLNLRGYKFQVRFGWTLIEETPGGKEEWTLPRAGGGIIRLF